MQTLTQTAPQKLVYPQVELERQPVPLWVGASHHTEAVPGQYHGLVIPPSLCHTKSEARVLGWVHALEDGTRAFVKLYSQRPWRMASEGVRTGIRVCREFDRLSRLEQAGVSCTRPLFWGRGRSAALGRFEVLATRLVEGARSLRQALKERPALAGELDWKEMLAQVAAMHAAGVHHSALSPKNVLIDRELRFHLCDLASSMRYPSPIGRTRMALFDLVHLFGGLGPLLGAERRRTILLEGTGDWKLTERVLTKAGRYRRRQVFQHQRLRAEFHLRNLWAWHASANWMRLANGGLDPAFDSLRQPVQRGPLHGEGPTRPIPCYDPPEDEG